MEAVDEVVAVCGSILDIVSKIENVKEDWFTVSDEYQSEAAILRSKLTYYEKQVCMHPQPVDITMMKTLKKAELTLKRAEARLNKLEKGVDGNQCCSQLWWFYAKVNLTLFPERLEKTLQTVILELQNISKNIKDEVEFSGLMEDAAKNRAVSTIVHNNDEKYVPIEQSQSKVIEAIEDSNGPSMILLHGGLGKGKSTLARYICERYGQFGERRNVFDHVIVVSFANSSKSDVATKQYEILEHLSPTSLTEESSSKTGIAKSVENIGSKSRIAKALHKFFIGKKILMILDGVSDKVFLYKMWEAVRDGKDDKILITSQRSDLCDDFQHDFVLIPMGDPNEEEARKILASLVGLESKTIPQNVQKYADKMIKATGGNPLALACLASTLSSNPDKKNMSAWRDAWRKLSQVLDHKDLTIVLGQNDDTATARSLWGAMKLCIGSLETGDAKRTLFLMYVCRGESVPDEVLRILCAGMKMSSSSFTRSRDELWMRQLLKREADILSSKMNLGNEQNEDELQGSPAWSLQSLVKLYMERHDVVGKEEVRAMIGALLGDHDDFSPESNIKCKQDFETEIVETETEKMETDETRVRVALCALYFDPHHTDQVVTGAVVKACKMSNLEDSDDTINDLRRKAIQPLIWLLDKSEEEEQWIEMVNCSVRKVLLEYVCKRQLDNENISYLLKLSACPSTQLATLLAITHISSIEETPLLNQTTISFLQAIVNLLNLKDGFHTSVQEAASKALSAVCWKAADDKSATLVANMSGVLDVLVHSLAIPLAELNAFPENAASALKGLASQEDMGIQQIIVNKTGVLVSLVNCLGQQSKPRLQVEAVGALGNLACTPDNAIKLRIAKEALVGLVNCLNQDHPDLQTGAAWALANLASLDDVALEFKVANEEGALAGLVNCLANQDHHHLQTEAAWALANLAGSEDDALKLRVANQEGALVSLVNCLANQDHHDLQTGAARALANLAGSHDVALELRVANEERALVGLVNCLANQDHPDLQREATWALANLAGSKDDALKLRLASEEGALVGLVNCLANQDHYNLQTQAARALANLADSNNDAMELRVANLEGALVGLVNCLANHNHHDLQTQAARALVNLANSKHDALKLRVANQQGALVGLVNCLTNQDHPDLQTQAARALENLARSKDDALKLRVASEEGALVGLVNCLANQDHHDLQTQAARALANLACSEDDAMELRVANQEGALVGLVNCLANQDHLDLQTAAGIALANLAGSTDDALKLRVACEEGALVGLVNCLANQDHHDLQTQAARALANLAGSKDDTLELRVANQEGALVGLVNCLANQDHHDLQGEAARALANLAASEDDALKLRVASEEGVLVGLVNCLANQDYHDLQIEVARALANLACSEDDALKLRVASEEGALAGLVNCLANQDHCDLQTQAARALANLVGSEDDAMELKVANQEGALVGLVNCLANQDYPDLQTQAARALANLASSKDDALLLRVANQEGALVGLVNCLANQDHHDLQTRAAWALANLAGSEDDALKLRVACEEGPLVGLVNCLANQDHHDLQTQAAQALANLASSEDVALKLRVANVKGALRGLVNCLSQGDHNDLQRETARMTFHLACASATKAILKGTEGLLEGLTSLVGDYMHPDTQYSAVRALFIIDPTQAREVGLLSAKLGVGALSFRIFVKATLGDLEGALGDANEAITMPDVNRGFLLQERGVLKQMMGDLEGSLADLDEGLKLEPNDYDILKHRGYVKFLLNDIEGACADAEWALTIQSSRSDDSHGYLGGTHAEYLDYKL